MPDARLRRRPRPAVNPSVKRTPEYAQLYRQLEIESARRLLEAVDNPGKKRARPGRTSSTTQSPQTEYCADCGAYWPCGHERQDK
jgi:hypothetical protein